MIFAISLNVFSTPGSIDVSTSTSDPILDRNKLEDIEPVINVPIEVEETE